MKPPFPFRVDPGVQILSEVQTFAPGADPVIAGEHRRARWWLLCGVALTGFGVGLIAAAVAVVARP